MQNQGWLKRNKNSKGKPPPPRTTTTTVFILYTLINAPTYDFQQVQEAPA